MPHIHTRPGDYDFTTSAIIIRTDLAKPAIFVSKHLLSGKWTQPGGHVEMHESPWSAVLHEVTEESGYTTGQLHLLQPPQRLRELPNDSTLQPQPVCILTYELNTHKGHFHTDIVYAFTVDGEPSQEIAEGESKDVRFMSRSELEATTEEDMPANVRSITLYVLDECLPHWETLPAIEW